MLFSQSQAEMLSEFLTRGGESRLFEVMESGLASSLSTSSRTFDPLGSIKVTRRPHRPHLE